VAAISQISGIIAQINDTQATIASAVEEQTATTNEMGRNVAEVVNASTDMAAMVTTTAAGHGETTRRARAVSAAAGELAQHATQLDALLAEFRC
jgi:methyl-accepting chemotaxis protein